MMRSFMNRQFLGFLLTGGLAAAVNFGSRIVYNRWLDFSSAVVLAYLTGMVTAFILARSFVFTQSSQSVQRSNCVSRDISNELRRGHRMASRDTHRCQLFPLNHRVRNTDHLRNQ